MSIRVGAIADIDGGQRVEVDAVQMPAVIVDVVFPSDFTVGGNVDGFSTPDKQEVGRPESRYTPPPSSPPAE